MQDQKSIRYHYYSKNREKIGRKIGKVAKNVLGPILAVIFNFAIDSLFGKDDFEKVRAHYSSHLNEITGYFPDYNNKMTIGLVIY